LQIWEGGWNTWDWCKDDTFSKIPLLEAIHFFPEVAESHDTFLAANGPYSRRGELRQKYHIMIPVFLSQATSTLTPRGSLYPKLQTQSRTSPLKDLHISWNIAHKSFWSTMECKWMKVMYNSQMQTRQSAIIWSQGRKPRLIGSDNAKTNPAQWPQLTMGCK
jgi:hypothetical protein